MNDLCWIKWHYDRSLSEFFSFPLSISFLRASPLSFIIWGLIIGPLKAEVQRHSLALDMNNTVNSKNYETLCCSILSIVSLLHPSSA
jgi:hypothetical protein